MGRIFKRKKKKTQGETRNEHKEHTKEKKKKKRGVHQRIDKEYGFTSHVPEEDERFYISTQSDSRPWNWTIPEHKRRDEHIHTYACLRREKERTEMRSSA